MLLIGVIASLLLEIAPPWELNWFYNYLGALLILPPVY